ncbi:MAG: phage terminase large subunit [Candidatus Omnitrophica bacterium]|nr:phage terminase large subunit [Candidatus Omnitrophota bacterium]MBU4468662.1 phage terminase large subunit [Candidatus Omnitrophota bacterium]MCG2707552.1 phage terminase large subunit [Candidatus Omnitrophota bacterium]
MNPTLNKARNAISELRRIQAEKSVFSFAKTYMMHHLKYPLAPAHLEELALLFDATNKRGEKIAIAAPRWFGKSTIVTLIYVVYCICFQKERFIVIISETSGQVEQLIENIKKELVENELLMADFPEIFENSGRPKPPRWTQDQIETRNGIKIIALGTQQPITGRKYGKYRPSLIILDDIESANKIYSAESAEKMNDWFNKSILKAGDESTNFLFIGTVHHPCCFFAAYIKPPIWHIKKYKAIISEPKHPELWSKCFNIKNSREDYNGKRGLDAARDYYISQKVLMDEGIELLWSSRWEIFDIMNMRDDDQISFSAEFQNEPIDIKTALLRVDLAEYWNRHFKSFEELLHYLGDYADFYLACDPCTGLDVSRGDYCAIIVIARDRRDGVLYVIIADIERRDVDKTIADILAYAMRFRFSAVGVEANGFQETGVKLLEERARKENIYLPVVRIKNTGDKYKRIHTLAPILKNRTLHLNEEHKILLEQMQFFPHAKHDDGPDALEMCVRLAEEKPRKVQVAIL